MASCTKSRGMPATTLLRWAAHLTANCILLNMPGSAAASEAAAAATGHLVLGPGCLWQHPVITHQTQLTCFAFLCLSVRLCVLQDLVVPSMKQPSHFAASPLIGGQARNRTWLAFHRGRVSAAVATAAVGAALLNTHCAFSGLKLGALLCTPPQVQLDNPTFSRGIRQRLAIAAKNGSWVEKYRIAVGEKDGIQGDYSELLASSVFCLVLPGDGWTARMEDATLHGCIPVIIMVRVVGRMGGELLGPLVGSCLLPPCMLYYTTTKTES